MPKKILIIEDEQNLTKALLSIFGNDRDYQAEVAIDGEEGLSKVKSFKPDIILLDLILPKVDGFSVLRTLKSDPELKNIPTVVITNLSDVSDKVMELGASDCLIKSDYTVEEIKNKVNDHFGAPVE